MGLERRLQDFEGLSRGGLGAAESTLHARQRSLGMWTVAYVQPRLRLRHRCFSPGPATTQGKEGA